MKNKKSSKTHYTDCDVLFRYAESLGFGEVHIKFDRKTGLRAIIAVHNLKRGSAIGGCRIKPYSTTNAAIEDVLRLACMMSIKAAATNLPHGGAKSVLIKPKIIKDRKAYLESFGDFINELNGRYIAAMDVGTTSEDMDIIATRTSFVGCTTQGGGDPSPQTALGVVRGIEAAVYFKLAKDKLTGIHVAIQGVGHVGYYLAKELHARGAILTVCDVNEENTQRCIQEFNAQVVPVDKIYDVSADVFAPCALGAILNFETIKRLRVPIVAGSANNQLAHYHHGALLQERGILYAPDFVINAGGLIYVAAIYDYGNPAKATEQVNHIYEMLLEIFKVSQQENIATNEVAQKIAMQRLQ